jgi:hypothetical protein
MLNKVCTFLQTKLIDTLFDINYCIYAVQNSYGTLFSLNIWKDYKCLYLYCDVVQYIISYLEQKPSHTIKQWSYWLFH